MAMYFILCLYIVTKAKLNKIHRYICKSIVYFPSIVVRPSTLILETQFEALLDARHRYLIDWHLHKVVWLICIVSLT